jgi:phage tail-like protein
MDSAGFLYLNVANRWPAFRWRGLELGADGALRLARVPLYTGNTSAFVDLPAPDGPAGVAIGPGGAVFFTDPVGDRLLRIDPCDSSVCPVPCVGGSGELPGQLRVPRGLVFHAMRHALVVADSGNHRLQLFDPGSFQVLGIWGGPGTEPGLFDTPWALTVDSQGSVYVVDYGNKRVQKFGLQETVEPAFWENAAAATLMQPVGVATGSGEDGIEVFVLDAASDRIAVFDDDGHLLRWLDLPAGDPLALLSAQHSLYVGDKAGRHVLRLLPSEPAPDAPLVGGVVIGEAEGFEGPVAALAADDSGGLWLHPGHGATPIRLSLAGGFVRSGVVWGGPFGTAGRPTLWHEIEVQGGPLVANAHLQLVVRTGGASDAPPDPPIDPHVPFAAPWKLLPLDALRGLIRGAPAEFLWIAARLSGQGTQTPVVEQVRIDYDPETWTRYLPAIYRTQAKDPELLERFLALYEGFFTDLDEQIDEMPRLFDPAVAPAVWLPWLASWVGIELDETWPDEKKRRAVAGAFAAAGKRGTPAGLREAVLFATGVDIRIVEPVLGGTWWALPGEGEIPIGGGRLGVDTVLAPAELDGAVLGTTAVLDGSYVAGEEGLGSHLYETVAHQFCVHVYERQVASAARLAAVRAVIEREKPAHTAWHLCVIKPRMRIGLQSRLGVDTVIAGAAPPQRLGRGSDLVLGGERPGRLGESSRIGVDTRLHPGVPVAASRRSNEMSAEEESWP